jgi:hypothetical protein
MSSGSAASGRIQERWRVADAMEPVRLNAKSEAIAKVRIKMIITAPAILFGKRTAKGGALFSMT